MSSELRQIMFQILTNVASIMACVHKPAPTLSVATPAAVQVVNSLLMTDWLVKVWMFFTFSVNN